MTANSIPGYCGKVPEGFYVEHFDCLHSTMDEMRKSYLFDREEKFVAITTLYQTAGHGQKGTVWESDGGKNLLASIAFKPCFLKPNEQFRLSQALALAIAATLDAYTGDISVKWPNDIYWNDRKICGMLLEHEISGIRIARTLTGFGININQPKFQGDAPNPVSLYQILGRETSLDEVFEKVISHFSAYYSSLEQGCFDYIAEEYARRLYRRDGYYQYRDGNGTFMARIVGVMPDGIIILENEQGQKRGYAFKEVAFVLPQMKQNIC